MRYSGNFQDTKLSKGDHANTIPQFHHRAMSPDDGGSKHLLNVSQFLRDYTAQHPRRQSSSRSVQCAVHI
jgi:hypothetical protein